MILLISPERIKLERCAYAQIKALEERLNLDDASDSSLRGRNVANRISDDGGLFLEILHQSSLIRFAAFLPLLDNSSASTTCNSLFLSSRALI